MVPVVYVLCTLTALACCALLLRAHRRTGTRLLLWSGICFGGLAVNNALVFVDLVIIPQMSIMVVRTATTMVSLFVLILALVWDDGGSKR